MIKTISVIALLAFTALRVQAQTETEIAGMTAYTEEIQKWVSEYKEWRMQAIKHGNRFVWGWWLKPESVQQKPPPPEELSGDCWKENRADMPELFREACELLEEYDQGTASMIAKGRQQVTQQNGEKVDHTSFWQYIHIDGLWMLADFNARPNNSPLGIVGMHVAIPIPGMRRVQIIVPPGAMFFRVPYGRDTKLIPGYTAGFSFKVTEFKMPVMNASTLHMNLARAWIKLENNIQSQANFFGASVTFGKKN